MTWALPTALQPSDRPDGDRTVGLSMIGKIMVPYRSMAVVPPTSHGPEHDMHNYTYQASVLKRSRNETYEGVQ